uniref:Uncharacterized protein n=1 Tax=Nicotiana tabacum TaxID=4097 RepID=A0A1S3Z1P0_TOBAC|nr:PREDICTED: uncharacterized protein LOC107782034 [Nicotiana tabacum]
MYILPLTAFVCRKLAMLLSSLSRSQHHVLQLISNVAVCPSGVHSSKVIDTIKLTRIGVTNSRLILQVPYPNLFVALSFRFLTYLSAICEDDVQGKKLMHAAINPLFCVPVSGSSENDKSVENYSETRDAKPALLWSVLYTQELTKIFQELYFESRVFENNSLYSHRVGVRSAYTLPFSDPTCIGYVVVFQELYFGEEFFPKTASLEEGAVEELKD